jgi:tetratricopeptide (TPR) repeat protein
VIHHPAADAARAAMAARRYDEAGRILEHAADSEPLHADLICERAWMMTLRGREDTALSMLDAAEGGVRHEALTRVLAAHYRCRREIDPRDEVAREACVRFRDVSTPDVGVRISACIIAKNEAKNLPRCLESLLGVVDEIVVVDTGSTDRTVAIAIEFGAVVGATAWQNDFAAARNASLDLATGHWVLWIDADEELSPESYPAIQRAICRPHFGGFDLEIVNLVDEREHGAHILHYPTRLFRRLPGVRFSGTIHEQIQPSIAALGLPCARLDGARLIHHGYRPSALADGRKLERTRTMLEEAVCRFPEDGFQWFNLANAHHAGRKFPEAERAVTRALERLEPGQTWRTMAWQILAAARYEQGRYAEALEACDACDLAGDGGIMNEYERASALRMMGRYEEALAAADRCLAYEWGPAQHGDVGVATHKRYLLRGQILGALERLAEAEAMFNTALAGDPGFAPARVSRAAIYEKCGQPERAIEEYERVQSDSVVRKSALKGLGRAKLAAKRRGAAETLATAWHEAPEDLDTWHLWIRACEAEGDEKSLLRAYKARAAREVLDAETLVDWGRALRNSGDFTAALDRFSQAIQLAPKDPNAYFNAGDLLYRLGAFAESANLYQAGLRYAPEHADAWFTLGNALAQMNLDEGARIAYDEALRLQPGHEGAGHNRRLIAA